MKKIVALVLSLVMVLGLATVAFGAVEYSKTNVNADGWVVTDFDAPTTPHEQDEDSNVEKVVYADYTETVHGKSTKYYGMTFYLFNDQNDAAVVCAKEVANIQIEDGAKIIYAYAFDASYLSAYTGYTKVVATDFVKGVTGTPKCGETTESYYVVGDKNVLPYDGGSVNPIVAMYKNEVVLLEAELDADGDPVMVEATLADHAFIDAPATCKWAMKDNELVSVKCACGDTFKVVQDIKGLKAGSYVSIGNGDYVVLAATPAVDTDTTDKVESAETFDAGIAMYVGMSVMAAAGSAVVLKKKD